MKRYLTDLIQHDLAKKMVVVTGPRQVGKTTLARHMPGFNNTIYLNFDSPADRLRIERQDWPAAHDYVVLDEIHAMPNWKIYLKGVFDTKPAHQALLVTGSARLDTFRQASESLAGRYFRWRLLPFSVRELTDQTDEHPDLALNALLRFSGFPEPLFDASDSHRARWQNQYFTDLIREDVLEYSRIQELKAMRTLVAMLRQRTGSRLSFESLARDLSLAPNTVRSYIDILEALHIVFLIRPYHRNIARAQAKAAKLYFYDWAYVQDATSAVQTQESGAQFENLVAVHLLKHICYLQDSTGFSGELNYLRTTAGKEIDFVLTNSEGDASHFIEVKLSDTKPSLALKQMAAAYPNAQAIQLVKNARHGFDQDAVQVRPAAAWLRELAA